MSDNDSAQRPHSHYLGGNGKDALETGVPPLTHQTNPTYVFFRSLGTNLLLTLFKFSKYLQFKTHDPYYSLQAANN